MRASPPLTRWIAVPSVALAIAALALFSLWGCTQGSPPRPHVEAQRFLWITRWDFRDERDVRRIVTDAAEAGFDALVFQVRGAASTLYPSSLEPRAPELTDAPVDFDPLRTALLAAHARGLEVHAWVNVVPSWWGLVPPADPLHVYNRHPEWHWFDGKSHRQALSEGFYVSLNPCLPGVRDYIVAVLEELVRNYDLDGLHLDYLRFPNEPPATPPGSHSDWPRDPATLWLYAQDTGLYPDQDRDRWDAWRSEQVTQLLRDIRAMVDECRPGLVLSAAVGSEPAQALAAHHQDVDAWIDEDLLDLILPMNYTSDLERFEERLERWEARSLATPVVMGLMLSGDAELRRMELQRAAQRYPALAVFAYHELFDSRNEVLTDQGEDQSTQRGLRRGLLLPALRRGQQSAD